MSREHCQLCISIHALCEEGDLDADSDTFYIKISIHALCEEGDTERLTRQNISMISIHALCEEGDEKAGPRYRAPVYFYPRPLRGGRRGIRLGYKATVKFLSTPSARRATCPNCL